MENGFPLCWPEMIDSGNGGDTFHFLELNRTENQALFLAVADGLTAGEIAQRMNRKKSTVQQTIYRARRKLKGRVLAANAQQAQVCGDFVVTFSISKGDKPMSEFMLDKEFTASLTPMAEAMNVSVGDVVQAMAIARFAQHSASQEVNGEAPAGREFLFEVDQDGNRRLMTGRRLYENLYWTYRRRYEQRRDGVRDVGLPEIDPGDAGGFSGEDGFSFAKKVAEVKRLESQESE